MKINHIGFIMDGNRRYSKFNSLDLKKGYKKGMLQFINFVKFQIKYNIYETSFYALSTKNYEKRPDDEKKTLGNLVKKFSNNEKIMDFFQKEGVYVELKGNLEEIERKAKKEGINSFFISELKQKLNQNNSKIKKIKFKTNIALNYGGQEEILHSFKEILSKIKSNQLKENEISIKTIKENLYFSNSKPPEIIVRPGNAPRLSGFMLWDSEYSEIYLTKKLWPELSEDDFCEILVWYRKIKRNFGR